MNINWIKKKFGMQKNKNKNKLGLALSGGAALGLSHVGVLKVMQEVGIEPAAVSGTSAGAIIGALYCSGMPVDEIEDIALSIDRMKTINLFAPSIQKGALIKDDNILKFFHKHFGDKQIEDLEIPFVAVSVDIESGDIVYLNKGSVIAAVRASISIPGIFPPFLSNGRLLVDGGIRSNLPLEVLKSFQTDHIIGVNVLKSSRLNMKSNYASAELDADIFDKDDNNIIEKITNVVQGNKKIAQFPSLVKSLFNSLQILLAESSQREIEIVQPDLVINVDVSDYKLWEFWKAEEMIKIGYKSAQEVLTKSNKIDKF